MGNKEIEILCYADDAILTAGNEFDLRRLVPRFNTTSKNINMIISTQKTKTIVLGKEPIRCKIEIDGTSNEQVMDIHYFGTTLSSHGDIEVEVRTNTET